VPALADLLKIDLLTEGNRIERVLVLFADDQKQQALAEKMKQFYPRPGWTTVQARVIQSGQPMLLADIPDVLRDRMAHDELHASLLRAAGVRSMMVVPLKVRGRTFGAMTFAAAESGRRYSVSNFLLAETVAGRVSATIENARLFAERKKAISARDAILAVVSHDLRNSLNVIQLKSYVMLQSPEAQIRTDGAFIQRRADEMGRLIQDLLDISSMEAGQLRLEKSRQAVSLIVKKVIEVFEFKAQQKSLRLESQFAAKDELEAECDPYRVHQVLANLIDNAIKFTPAGGAIIVSVAPGAGEVCFSVADSGAGIPEADLVHVFDRFWSASKPGRRGTGLGLSIAKGLVESQGGRIWAESQVGVGSTFFFTLPFALADSEESAGERQAESISGSESQMVLVVDDDADNREALKKTLEREGYEVTIRKNGAEALEYLRQAPHPYCVLLDLIMPVMDGWTFLRERNRDPDLSMIPVVVLSGDESVEKQVAAAHANYLQKPISRQRLAELLQRAA
jgi:signal transduction histidine kinase/CheY-like chemotaxis protein